MRFRKVLCGVTAALTVLSSTAIVAQADFVADMGSGSDDVIISNPNELVVKCDGKILEKSQNGYVIDDLEHTFTFEIPDGPKPSEEYDYYWGGFGYVSKSESSTDEYVCTATWSTKSSISFRYNTFTNGGLYVGIDACEMDIMNGNISPRMDGDGDFSFFSGYWLGSLNNGESYSGNGSGQFLVRDYYDVLSYDFGIDIYGKPGDTVELTFKKKDNVTMPEGQATITDESANVTVAGDFPEGTSLKAALTSQSETSFTYDITPVDASGNKVQPNGNATVKLPLPETFIGKNVYMYTVVDGKRNYLDSSVEGNYVVFKVDHFSEYVMTTEKLDDTASNSSLSSSETTGGDNNPSTGAALALLPVVLIGGAAVVVAKKRNK